MKASPEIPSFGMRWKAGSENILTRHLICAKYDWGNGAAFHRAEVIKALWPGEQWHEWTERRISGFCRANWLTWFGPAGSAKSTDAAKIALGYYLEAPHETTIIVCSTTMKMLRKRIWSEVGRLHSSIPKEISFADESGREIQRAPVGNEAELIDSDTMVRWKHGDTKHGIFGLAVEEGPIEEVVNTLIGVHAMRVLLILDEMQAIREAIVRATYNMASNPEFRFIGMGNPESLLDPLGKASEPIEGWDSIIAADTAEWPTVGGPTDGHGLCQFFDGRKSPADKSPEEQKRLNFLTNKKFVDRIIKGKGGNMADPDVWKFAIGWPAPMGLESTILDASIMQVFGCSKKAVWTKGFTRRAALDAAFGGGDDAVLQFLKCGEVEDAEGKRWLIEFGETLKVPINAESKRPLHYQITDFCRVECEKRQVKASEFALDTGGEGGALESIFRQEWGAVVGIEPGGSPSDARIDETGKTAKEAYDTRASELCFGLRTFAMSNGIRSLPEEAAKQACARRTFYRNGKWCAEPKTGSKGRTDERGRPVKGFKQRLGFSPDEFDACAVGVALCMEKGAVAVVGEAKATGEDEREEVLPDESSEDQYLIEDTAEEFSFI